MLTDARSSLVNNVSFSLDVWNWLFSLNKSLILIIPLSCQPCQYTDLLSILKGHCHEHNFKNSTAQKHVYTIGNLLTVAKFSKNSYTSVLKLNIERYHCGIGSFWSQLEKCQADIFKFCPCGLEKNWWKLFTVTFSFKQYARYPSLYVLGAFLAWLKVLSCIFGTVLLKKQKNVCDSVPLIC